MVFEHSNNPFDGSILNSNASRSEVPFVVNTFKCHSTLLYKFQHCINNLISMVYYDCGFTIYCYYLVFTWVSVL